MIGRSLLGASLAVLLAGCATKADVSNLESRMVSEIRDLQAQQEDLVQSIGMAFDTLSQQERRQLAGRGELQRQFDRLGELLAQLLELTSQNNALLSEMRAARVGGDGGEAGPRRAAGAPQAGERGDEARTFYEAAQQQFRRGSYETARAGFEDFLENYPDHELAPDARYFLAESLAEAGEPDRAVEEYRRVVELHPDSQRAPTALYKLGMLEVERGNASEARRYFERVELGYPNSPEAQLARDQLRRLRQ